MSATVLNTTETYATPATGVGFQLRLESGAFAAAAIVAYAMTGASWWLFAVLILAPDLGMLGYLAGPRVGARIYNAAHNLAFAAIAIGLGWYFAVPVLLALGLIWVAHISIDRTLGYGLKLPDSFKHTHLGPIGKH